MTTVAFASTTHTCSLTLTPCLQDPPNITAPESQPPEGKIQIPATPQSDPERLLSPKKRPTCYLLRHCKRIYTTVAPAGLPPQAPISLIPSTFRGSRPHYIIGADRPQSAAPRIRFSRSYRPGAPLAPSAS